MTWTLSRSIRRRQPRIPLMHNDNRSYCPLVRPRRFIFRVSTPDRPHPGNLSESKPIIGKRTRDDFENTLGPRSHSQDDEDIASQSEPNLMHNSSGKRLKYMQSPEEWHPCHRNQQEETQCGSSMHTPQTINNITPLSAFKLAGTTSAFASEASLQQPDALNTSDAKKESTDPTNSDSNVADTKEDNDATRGSEEARSVIPEKNLRVSATSFKGQEGLERKDTESEPKKTQGCSSDDELELRHLDFEDREARIAEEVLKKGAINHDSTSTDADTVEPTNDKSEAVKNDDENTSESLQIPRIMSRRPLFPITNDIIHKYQSAKVILDFWAQLERISTSEGDFIRLFTALYNDEDSEAVARLPPPPVFPLKSCLKNSSILQRLNAPTATPSRSESHEPMWRSKDGIYQLNDIPNDLHDLAQSYLDYLLQKYDLNRGWSQDFIIANLRKAVLSAKAGLLSSLNGETTTEENETRIKQIVNRKCANTVDNNANDTRPLKVKFSEEVNCLNIDDGSRSQIRHPEEGVWSKFARGTKPVKNPESESARAQIEGLALVEEESEGTQNFERSIDSPSNNGNEPSGHEEQDQNCSTDSSLLPKFAPIPRRPKSHWKTIIRHLDDAAREVGACQQTTPLQTSGRDCGVSISPHVQIRRREHMPVTREHDLRFVRPENILHENHEDGGEGTNEEDNDPGFSVWQDSWNDPDQERRQTEGEDDDPEFTVRGHELNVLDEERNADNGSQDGEPGFTVWNDRWNAQVSHDEFDDYEDWDDYDTDDLDKPLIDIWDNDLNDDDDDKENRHSQFNGTGVLTGEEEEESESGNGYNDEKENMEPAASSHFRMRVFHKPTSPEYSSPACQANEYSLENESDVQWSPRRSPCHFMPEHDFEESDEPVANPRTPRNRTRVFHRQTSPVYDTELPSPASPVRNGTVASPTSKEREMPHFPISPVFERDTDSLYSSPTIDRPLYRTSPSPEPWCSGLFPDPESPSFER